MRIAVCISSFLLLFCGCAVASLEEKPVRFSLYTRPFFIKRGERVSFDFRLRGGGDGRGGGEDVEYEYISTLLRPCESYEKLLPSGVDTHFSFRVDEQSKDGLYVVTGYVRRRRDGLPLTLGIAKRSFLLGRIVADFLCLSLLPSKATREHLRAYIKSFKALGGNLLIVHPLITAERALYPSGVCRRSLLLESDMLTDVLSECDTAGLPVLLSLGWDVSSEEPYIQRFQSMERIMNELYYNYGPHPSFCGFFSYLDGGSLDYALYIRTFTKLVKSLDEGLLTACAPYFNRPLLAGYLASFKELDIIIPQTLFCSSRSPNDGRSFSAHRCSDFIRIFAGAAATTKKTVLPSIELFLQDGKPISPDEIKDQILSVASVNGLKGVLLNSYHRNIYNFLDRDVSAQEAERTLKDCLVAFNAIQRESLPNPPVMFYYPLSERMATDSSIFELLDSLRSRGIPSGVAVFVPTFRESLPPFPPVSPAHKQIRFLGDEGVVVVVADVRALNSTDCSFIFNLLSAGTTFIVSGVPLPTGTELDQKTLFGTDIIKRAKAKELMFRYDMGRFLDRDTIEFKEERELPFMVHKGGIKLLTLDEELSLVQMVPFAEGRLYVTTLRLNEQAAHLQEVLKELIRDAVSYARGEELPLMLTSLPSSIIIGYRWEKKSLTMLIVNPSDEPLESEIAVPKILSEGFSLRYLNRVAESGTYKIRNKESFKVKVEPHWYLLLRLEPLESEK